MGEKKKSPSQGDWNMLAVIGIVVAVIGLLILVYAFFVRSEMSKFVNSGVQTEAIVMGGEMLDGDVTAYSLDVSFGDFDEKVEATIDSYLTEDIWNSYEIGDQVDVIFLPDNPEKVILAETAGFDKLSPVASYPIGIGGVIVGSLMAVSGAIISKYNGKI